MKSPITFPPATADPPVFQERITAFLLVFIPYIIIYEYFILAGIPAHPIYTNLPFEANWPVIEWTEIFYNFTYCFALLIPFILNTKNDLRAFIADMWFGTAVGGLIYLVFPFVVHQRSFTPQTWLGHVILLERAMDGETGALPSFHVIWAFFSAKCYTVRYPKGKWVWYLLAILIAGSCLTTGAHSVPDVVAGLAVFWLIFYRQRIFRIFQR
jgi:membrane-associated phospholipid phosphatase